ncbi:polyprenyl synthetase family protein [Rothia amarae]|uniref:Polyprenyl synthetase family protein n=1 Tax=Rothia amarae TaxID=169480 RepID=A0A7H2BHR8_9MICC|nr:polyprenyl synthetase family protein [Rothia amarae]QNV39214.1 polyprenyl synthetase family protein [Rothia amarae]
MGTAQQFQSVAAEEKAYLAALEEELSYFFAQQKTILESISPESLPLLESIQQLSTGGKRLRALLAYWGNRSAGGDANSPEIIRCGAAIELFQSAALIHDDIIDRSDTRRGAPAVHRRFQAQHTQQNWRTDSETFGISSAIITGDLCLSWSEQMFNTIGEKAQGLSQGRAIFDLMRTEVMAGQYLDILGEVVNTEKNSAAITRSRNVLRFKSAKYSCEHPLVLGAALALSARVDEPAPLLQNLSQFGLPLGEAFQMRDDVLGVFGESAITGKPTGDDLREGKRTLLIALTQQKAEPALWEKLDSALGNQDLTETDIVELQNIIIDCGALASLEAEIEKIGQHVISSLEAMPIEETPRLALENIVARLLHRAS